jgi:8-oxo-dGTP pyrophosphatase MutT (NUDIX family)
MKSFEKKREYLEWKEIRREKLLEGSIFNICRARRRSSEGTEGDFIILEAPDWVTVIPVFSDEGKNRRFLMVEQYRHGSGKVTVEFPAGTVEEGEDPLSTAGRELLEETGYRASRLIPLGDVSPNPAFMNNRVHFFLATGLEKTGEQSLDEHEQIHCSLHAEEEVRRRMGTDGFDNGVMLMALEFYERYLKTEKESIEKDG